MPLVVVTFRAIFLEAMHHRLPASAPVAVSASLQLFYNYLLFLPLSDLVQVNSVDVAPVSQDEDTYNLRSRILLLR